MKNKMKKAQAAMEFMMTYGWTILVIIIAGGALVYFDVLNPGKFLPDSCNIEGFTCTDFKLDKNYLQLYITNNIGDDIAITNITFGSAFNDTSMNMQLGKSKKMSIDVSGLTLEAGGRYKADIKIKFSTLNSGITHTNTGEIATIVEES